MAKKISKKPGEEKIFPVVGIGASAGGIEAFKLFTKHIPEDSGMAYVLLQHLHPDFKSTLTDIIQRETKIPVVEITDNIKLLPDHIYIVPSNKILTATDGILQLNPRESKTGSPNSIDIFFSSLAEVHQSLAIGIILSGSGSDGAIGLKKIKDYGGITFAQQEESAAFNGMPRNAIDTGLVDFIMTPEEMPAQLAKLNNTLQNIAVYDVEAVTAMQEEDDFKQILSLIRVRRGVDFTYYKQSTIRRRILRRMVINKIEELPIYLQQLRESKAEQDTLYQDLLIPVTSFFRDAATFDHLCESVFPEMLKEKSTTQPLRIWVAGCSTGEEAYSIGMCLYEYLGEKIASVKVQIFATDISERNIDRARHGLYSKRELEGVSEQRLYQFFNKIDGHYQLKKMIRDMCLFAVHNFLKDPPFARIDVVSCRNVLIYMEPYLQKKALNTFHYSLKEKGFLLLGKSETTGNASELFNTYGKYDKLYVSKPAMGRMVSFISNERTNRITKPQNITAKPDSRKNDFQRNADEILLARFSPVGVVVDEQFDILQFRGATGDFLEGTPGKASLNILKMAREGLAFEIRNALHKAKFTGGPVVKQNILIREGMQSIDIEVIPLLNTIELHYLILFRHSEALEKNEPREKENTQPANITAEQAHIRQLEKDLAQLREDMRSITEEQEAANEELQSANEELLSGSEELQSVNEELETSKEELQSTNEELLTINQELFDRSEQYNQARLYTETIVKTIHEPLLVLNHDLRIKSANQSFYETFGLGEEATEHRILFELEDGKWDMPELRTPLLKIQRGKQMFDEWEVAFEFFDKSKHILRVNARIIESPWNEQMIMLAFDDITLQKKEIETLKQNAETIKRSLHIMEDFFTHAPAGFCILKEPEHYFQFANPAFKQMFGKEDIIGKKYKDVFHGRETKSQLEIFDKIYQKGESHSDVEVPFVIERNGITETVFMDLSYQVMRDESGAINGILAFSYDVTEKVKKRRQLEAQANVFETLVMKVPAAITIMRGPQHVYDLVNPKYNELFGNRPLIGRTMPEALPEVDTSVFTTIMDHVFESGEIYIGTEIPIEAEFEPGKPAYEKYFTMSFQPMYDENEDIYAILTFSYEITDQVLAKNVQRKNEEDMKIILETIPHMAYVTDAEGEITFHNKRYEDYTGLNLENGRNYGWLSIFPPDMLPQITTMWEACMKTGEQFDLNVLVRKASDNSYRWHLSRATSLRDEKNQITKWVGTLTDIHDQILFAEELENKVQERTESVKEANNELKRSNKNLEQFASIASHDLQEPLRKIQTFITILNQKHQESLPPVAKELTEKIHTSVKRMSTLVKDVLTYSKITRPETAFVYTDLNAILKNVLQDFDLSIKEKNAVVNTGELPIIEAIPLQMNQLFYNLIANSLKFIREQGNAQIDITAKKMDEAEIKNYPLLKDGVQHWELIFADNGIGFDPQFAEQIFMIFQRLNETNKYAGTGIGLALCQNIVFTHKGIIWAVGNPGVGASFHIILPEKQAGH